MLVRILRATRIEGTTVSKGVEMDINPRLAQVLCGMGKAEEVKEVKKPKVEIKVELSKDNDNRALNIGKTPDLVGRNKGKQRY